MMALSLRCGAALLALGACGRFPTAAPGPDVERCQDDGSQVTCSFQQAALPSRNVQWQVPQGAAPAPGWPAVVAFHGSFVGTNPFWHDGSGELLGGYRLGQTTRALLDRGYAVLAPQSIHDGRWFWNTNVVGFSDNWGLAPDHQMMLELLEAIGQGVFGPIDPSRLYAAGISSGGYMTSRMAVSYPGRFKALAVHSASYATCTAGLCSVPPLPPDHPPTLFLHGQADDVVPVGTMRAYESRLREQGLEVDTLVSPAGRHEWLEAAVARVPDWFDAHP